uniref:CD2-associated protein n=2 Tax=Lygus hesperus TaxID=30085 RepID=A0A0A9YD01_LYGHE
MAQALVEYNYDAVEPDELTIRKGDIITDIVFNSKGWWEGTLNRDGKRGMFPDNFVKLMSDPDGLASSRQSPSGRKCKVLFSYKPAIEDELELQVGDVIDIIAEVEEGWWKGKLKDKIGVFPSNFVEETTNRSETREASQRTQKISQDETSKTSNVVGVQEQTTSNSHTVITTSSVVSESSPPIDVPALPPKPVKEMCKVIYNYEAANPDELTLHEGDVITLITREGQDPGWWKGEYKGKVGLFPDNFVQVISASEELSPVSKPDRPSKVLPTSKSKESINKAMTSSMSNIASISRKYSDNVRQDEKPNLLSKKPVLPPPPLKKPQRSSSDLAKSPTAPNLLSSKHVDTSPTILHSLKPSSSTTSTTIRSSASNSENITVNSSSLTSSKRTILEKSGDSLDGALWSKSGSYSITSESSHAASLVSSSSSTIITSIGGGDDLDLVGRAAMLTHPTASRVKAPKRRPPSTIYSGGELNNGEESSETTSSSLSTSASSTTVTTMLNGDADAHSDKPSSNKVPWVEELKLNQAKKQAGNNKTRVMIGGTESTSSTVQSVTTSVSSTNISTAGSTSPEAAKTVAPTVTGVTLRSHQATSSGSATVPTPRPQSMVSSLRSALVSPQASDSTITVTTKQWNELLEKVSRMELQLESQLGSLNRTVKDLTAQLEEEKRLRHALRLELDKLSELVTQV